MDNAEIKHKQVIKIEDGEDVVFKEDFKSNRIDIICSNTIISMPIHILRWLYETSGHFDKPKIEILPLEADYRTKYEQLLEKYVDMTIKFANFIDKKF